MINREDYKSIVEGGGTKETLAKLNLKLDPDFISLGLNGVAENRYCALNFNLSYARLKAEYNKELVKDSKVKADVKGANLNLPPEPKELPKTIKVTKSR
ncbi:MAG: hypothetical protein E7019_00635 [Alphaproteobacteria bacterium]|nr:hypothetical protein [Alphaproteobacteria bacterium]